MTDPSAEDRLYADIWEQKKVREADLGADGSLRRTAALPLLEGGETLLDVGCGEGTLAAMAREKFRAVHGIDISHEAVRLAAEHGVRAVRVNLNTEPIPHPDMSFDAVVTLDVIEHVFDPVRFVREIHRVLRPGGALVISTPNIRKLQRIWSIVRGRFPRTSYDPVGFDGGHLHYFTSLDLKTLLEDNGYHVVLVDGICGDRRTWKYRLMVAVLGRGFEKEFLSSAIIEKAIRPREGPRL
jgi:methionine biosynthesis protein MetW